MKVEEVLFIETGMGVDVHGQDVNVAATRAVKHAMHFNSLPGLKKILPDGDLNKMRVHVKLAIPRDLEKLDKEIIKSLIPYGQVTVEVMEGGMATTSGIFLEEQGDKNDLMYIAIAAIEVGY